MEFQISDSSGTDDDFRPSHQNRRVSGGRTNAKIRSQVIGTGPLPQMLSDMEAQIHQIEKEAYSSVLRAFKAQSDVITWETEGLITELRKELRVTDDEHRELLSRANADDIIMKIREWRKARQIQSGMLNGGQPFHEPMRSPTLSASSKKHRMSHSVASLGLGVQMQPSSSAVKHGNISGARGKKPKSNPSTDFIGRAQVPSRGSADDKSSDPLIGRKVWTRWPEDNSFYEAVISDYNPIEKRHALVYDSGTAEESLEWVNINEISPNDIRWRSEDVGISHKGGRNGSHRGSKKVMTCGGSAIAASGRGRGAIKNQTKKQLPRIQNGKGKKAVGDIEILHTETLIKEVEKVFSASHADPLDIERAKDLLKEHEQSLVDAIARLEAASDGESDKVDQHKFFGGRSTDQENGSRKQNCDELHR